MKAPPLLPEETFHRVIRVANIDGLSVMGIAGFLALAAASVGEYRGAAVGLLVAAAGAIELHGVGLLRAREARGMQWIIASQPYLMAVMLVYCALRLMTYDAALVQAAVTDDLRGAIAQAGYQEERFLRKVYTATYASVAVATLLYQGGMIRYYLRRRQAVETAVEDEGRG